MKKTPAKPPNLPWKDISFITQALTLTPWAFKAAIKNVTAEYRLGPRGAWVLRLIETRDVIYPLDISHFFSASRSVITDELARLTEVDLITYRKSNDDRRRIELALTPLGKEVSSRIWEELRSLITGRFKSYSRDEVLRFTRMLQDLTNVSDISLRAQSKDGLSASGRRTSANGVNRERRSRVS